MAWLDNPTEQKSAVVQEWPVSRWAIFEVLWSGDQGLKLASIGFELALFLEG